MWLFPLPALQVLWQPESSWSFVTQGPQFNFHILQRNESSSHCFPAAPAVLFARSPMSPHCLASLGACSDTWIWQWADGTGMLSPLVWLMPQKPCLQQGHEAGTGCLSSLAHTSTWWWSRCHPCAIFAWDDHARPGLCLGLSPLSLQKLLCASFWDLLVLGASCQCTTGYP